MKKIIKIAVTAVLALILTPALALLLAGAAVNGLANRAALASLARESGWIEGVERKIRADFEPLCHVSGVPRELTDAFLDDTLDEETAFLFWGGPEADIPQEELTKDLAARIRALAEKMREDGEIFVSDEDWAVMNENFEATARQFTDAERAAVHLRGKAALVESVTDAWAKAFPHLVGFTATLTAGSVALAALIHRKKVFAFLYAAFSASGLVLIGPVLYLMKEDFAGRLQLGPDYLKAFLEAVCDAALNRVLIAGIAVLAAGIACGIAAFLLSRKAKNESEKREEHDPKVSG